jgi:hypothetical protein
LLRGQNGDADNADTADLRGSTMKNPRKSAQIGVIRAAIFNATF